MRFPPSIFNPFLIAHKCIICSRDLKKIIKTCVTIQFIHGHIFAKNRTMMEINILIYFNVFQPIFYNVDLCMAIILL